MLQQWHRIPSSRMRQAQSRPRQPSDRRAWSDHIAASRVKQSNWLDDTSSDARRRRSAQPHRHTGRRPSGRASSARCLVAPAEDWMWRAGDARPQSRRVLRAGRQPASCDKPEGAFHAHRRGDAAVRQVTDQRIQGYAIKDLLGVSPHVLGRQSHPGPFADACAIVRVVLQLAQLGVRGKFPVMLVADLRDAQCCPPEVLSHREAGLRDGWQGRRRRGEQRCASRRGRSETPSEAARVRWSFRWVALSLSRPCSRLAFAHAYSAPRTPGADGCISFMTPAPSSVATKLPASNS